MRTSTSRNWLLLGAFVGVVAIVVVGGAALARDDAASPAADGERAAPTEEPATASTETVSETDERGPGWYQSLVQADEAAPRADGVFNGIRIGPDVNRSDAPCERGTAERVAVDEAYETDLDPRPDYLPDGATEAMPDDHAVACDGVLVSAEAHFSVAADVGDAFGGPIIIFRTFIEGDEAAYPLDHAEGRVSEAAVSGNPAALAEPLTDDGFGRSALVIHDPAGIITVIHAGGLTAEELLRVGESLD